MDLFKQGMKGPTRPAPSIPGQTPNVTRYSPVTNWNDDPFGADVFEPTPQFMQKKKPPPRPPPPKVNSKPPEVPLKPSHFIRKPTVLTALLSRKKATNHNQNGNVNAPVNPLISELNADIDPHKMFPKCEPKIVQTGALIDLSSPPSSPTFTTRSSSDGLSVDSFGSDATTSTNHHNVMSGGNASQAESGFEDDFDLFLHSRKGIPKDDTLDDFTSVDPFSPQPLVKPPVLKKPVLSKDLFELSSSQTVVPVMNGPTIIRAKPARPKPPDNSALLKNTFGGSFPVTSMNVNTTTPIQKVANGYGDSFDWKTNWEDESPERESPEREWSPPMPSVPPPPPPVVDDLADWPEGPDVSCPITTGFADSGLNNAGFDGDGLNGAGINGAGLNAAGLNGAELFAAGLTNTTFPAPVSTDDSLEDPEEPTAVALFDYFTDHPDDLCFSVGARIKLIRRVDNEWLHGRLRSGVEGVFPANYVEIKVPLPNETVKKEVLGVATALYDFHPVQTGDLKFSTGDTITVMYKISDEWYYGECNDLKGQFPVNYVEMS